VCRILLVVDDADLRELWTMVLEAEGHSVATAADGVAGMASYDTEPPDGVITDLQFPKLPGRALIALVRSLQADARTIAVSGNNAKLPEPGGSEPPRPSANRSRPGARGSSPLACSRRTIRLRRRGEIVSRFSQHLIALQ
jgi:CheY-like chemotaxis protein